MCQVSTDSPLKGQRAAAGYQVAHTPISRSLAWGFFSKTQSVVSRAPWSPYGWRDHTATQPHSKPSLSTVAQLSLLLCFADGKTEVLCECALSISLTEAYGCPMEQRLNVFLIVYEHPHKCACVHTDANTWAQSLRRPEEGVRHPPSPGPWSLSYK